MAMKRSTIINVDLDSFQLEDVGTLEVKQAQDGSGIIHRMPQACFDNILRPG